MPRRADGQRSGEGGGKRQQPAGEDAAGCLGGASGSPGPRARTVRTVDGARLLHGKAGCAEPVGAPGRNLFVGVSLGQRGRAVGSGVVKIRPQRT